jgi:hypothetical protein
MKSKTQSEIDAAEAAETDAAERWLDELDPDDVKLDDARYLRDIRNAAKALEDAEYQLRVAVAAARVHGETWGQIGMVLGVSRQAAQQRFKEIDQVTANRPSSIFDFDAAFPMIDQLTRRLRDQQRRDED